MYLYRDVNIIKPWCIIIYSALDPFRFLVVSGGLVYLYCVLYQGIDQEEYGGAWELLKEGMMTAFAMFMVHHNCLTCM